MKKLFFVLTLAAFGFTAQALSIDDFSLEASPFFGFKYGQFDEYVFWKDCEYPDDKLSELNWEIKPEVVAGIKVKGGFRKIFAEAGFNAGLPNRTGLLCDSDWLNVNISGAEDYQYKTYYSESDNYLERDINFSFKAGYSFEVLDWLTVNPAAGFDFENIRFAAKNLTKWYGSMDSNGIYHPYSDSTATVDSLAKGTVIQFERESYIAWLGTDARIYVTESFAVDTGFFLAPYVYALSFDSHNLTNIDYADLTQGFLAAYKWNLGVTVCLSNKSSVSLASDFFYMPVLRGTAYGKESKETEYYRITESEGGAGAFNCCIALSYRHRFF